MTSISPLSLSESISCICDAVQTRRFLEGIRHDVRGLAAQRDGVIHVVDAGCGAVPILGIYAALLDERVRVTCLELNPESARMARAIVKAAGLSDRVSVVWADAITFQPRQAIDLLISETMHSGLTCEPIVPILENLSRYVSDGGRVLPRSVAVEATLVPTQALTSRAISYRGDPRTARPYVEGEWREVARYTPGAGLSEVRFRVPVPSETDESYLLYVASTVDLGGAGTLGLHDSLITTPRGLLEASTDHKQQIPWIISAKAGEAAAVDVRYVPGDTLVGAGRLV